jgi:3-methyl-2-oxobutanoate hydroxymethyltransferase
VPTISIGGGPFCSGQLLVTPDVLGMFDRFTPSFAKRYQEFNKLMRETFTRYAEEVRSRVFPGEAHSYKMSDEVLETIEAEFGKVD